MSFGIKKNVIVAIIIAGLLALSILCYIWPRPDNKANGIYLRALRTGELIGPINLPKGQFPSSLDEQNYIIAEPDESELELRKHLLRPIVTTTMIDVPLNEPLDHIMAAYFGSEATLVRIELADESEMPRISIDARNIPLYEVLFDIALQANVYISIENGAIVLSQKDYKERQTLKSVSERKTDDSGDMPKPQAKLPAKPIVVEKVACEPDRLKLLLDKDNAGCPNLIIRSLDGRPFSITAIRSPADCITAKFNPDVKATEFILEPKVYIEKLKNPKGRLSICLDHPDGNVVYVLFDVLPEFTVNPPLLVVLNAEPEKPLVRKISVLSNYGRDFEIESLSSKSSFIGVKVLGQTKLNNGYQLDLEIKPPPAKGKTKFTDEFSIDFKSGEKLTLRCNGFYRK